MKIKICDICYNKENGKIVKSRWRISYKDKSRSRTIALDVCDEHKDFLEPFKTFDFADQAVDEMYINATAK